MAKIKFKDLSGALKTIIVFSWIMFGIYGLAFIIGFVEVMLGY